MPILQELEILIERAAEKTMDNLDQLLLSGNLSQEDYDQETLRLSHWVNDMFAKGFQDD